MSAENRGSICHDLEDSSLCIQVINQPDEDVEPEDSERPSKRRTRPVSNNKSGVTKKLDTLHECHICTQSFRYLKKWKQHIVKKHYKSNEDEYTCKVCHKAFRGKGHLIPHYKLLHARTEPKEYKCTDCDMKFDNNYALCGHRKAHSENLQQKGKFECKICLAKLLVSSSLKRHYRLCHGVQYRSGMPLSGPFPCVNCNDVFQDCDELKRHIKSCETQALHGGQRAVCELCNKAFTKKWLLEKHKRSHPDAEWKLFCETCGLGFLGDDNLDAHHTRRECRGSQFMCDTCNKQFQTPQNLKRHQREIHNVGMSSEDGVRNDRPHKCPVCDKTFVQKGHLNRHMGLHSDNPKPHECDVCKKSFAEVHQLKRHLLIHSGDHPEQCDTCRVSFRTVYELNQHRQMHLNNAEAKKFECDYCGRFFPLKSRLMAHVRVHTDEKPYKCSVCSMTFRYYHGLYRHKAAHYNPPGMKCERCGKVFKDKIGLAGHMKHVHATLKRMACEVCGKCYLRLSDLHAHRALVSRERPHKCPYCCCAYLSRDSLKKHKKILHGKVKPYVCPTCKDRYKERGEMIAHIQDKHLVKEKFNMYMCDFPKCSRSFMTQHHLERHLCTHKRRKDAGQGISAAHRRKEAVSHTSKSKLEKRTKTPPVEKPATVNVKIELPELMDADDAITDPIPEAHRSVHVVNLFEKKTDKHKEDTDLSGLPQLLTANQIKQEPLYEVPHDRAVDYGGSMEGKTLAPPDVKLSTIGSVTLISAPEPAKKPTAAVCHQCGVEFSNSRLLDIHQIVHSSDA